MKKQESVDRLAVFATLVRLAATARPRGPFAHALLATLKRRLPELTAKVLADFGRQHVIDTLRLQGVVIENRE